MNNFEQTKKLLYSYRSMLAELISLQEQCRELAVKAADVPSCIAKYGGRMPSGDSPSMPERYAMRNERINAKYQLICDRIAELQGTIDKIDYCFHSVLSQREKELCHMKFVDGMSYTEIVGATGLPSRWVERCVKRGIQRMEVVLCG